MTDHIQRVGILTALLAVLVTGGACGSGPTGSSAPTLPSPPPTGEITISSATLPSGATVAVRNCAPVESELKKICTDALGLTFDVLIDQDIPDAVLTVDFEDGGIVCSSTRTPPTALSRGRRTSMSTSLVWLSLVDDSHHDGDDSLICPVPASTSRMLVRLWLSGRPASPLVTKAFERNYTFSMQ